MRADDQDQFEQEPRETTSPDGRQGQPEDSETAPTQAEPAVDQSEEIASLRKELEEARIKSNEYLDGWQRARAEFANYKRRIEREQAQTYQNAAGKIIKNYLEILDDLERALKNRPKEGEGASWAEGIELIYRKLQAILEAEGIIPMQAVGQPFDPNLHEAVVQEESDQYESGQVMEELKKGYMQGDRVLRPATVKIAK